MDNSWEDMFDHGLMTYDEYVGEELEKERFQAEMKRNRKRYFNDRNTEFISDTLLSLFPDNIMEDYILGSLNANDQKIFGCTCKKGDKLIHGSYLTQLRTKLDGASNILFFTYRHHH